MILEQKKKYNKNVQDAIIVIQEDYKDLRKNYLTIGEKLNFIRDVTNMQEFQDIVEENFEFSLSKAYVFMNIYDNREYINKTADVWKIHEVLKIQDKEEMKEFEESYEPYNKSIREVREDRKEFVEIKNLEKIDNKQTFINAIKFSNKIKDIKKEFDKLQIEFQEATGIYEGLLMNYSKEWNIYPRKKEIEYIYNKLKKGLDWNVI